ncbi:hypothetical protein [Actinoplanes sp. NPDC051411]|uniref:hypothetical protein n=1 Tax=Actinoplanes sp. NPDC051411 TaxID=3155522 RepID=UPI003425BE49
MSAIVLATGACVHGSNPTEPEPSIGPIPTIDNANQLNLPLDAYDVKKKEYVSVRRAAWILTGDCVARFGGTYTLPESVLLDNLPPFELGNSRRYGLIDSKNAGERGYDLPPSIAPSSTTDSTPQESSGKGKGAGGWNPSDAELVLVRGAEPGKLAPKDANGKELGRGGCSAEADQILAQGFSSDTTIPQGQMDENLPSRLAADTFHQAERDSRVVKAMKEWSDCMQRSGYSYKSIWDPNNENWPEPPAATEIATATADVKCKREVNLTGMWFAVEIGYQNRVVAKNSAALDILLKYHAAQARNAARVAGG